MEIKFEDFIPVGGAKELPLGSYLVKLAKTNSTGSPTRTEFVVANKPSKTLVVVGGFFHFDMPKIEFYHPTNLEELL